MKTFAKYTSFIVGLLILLSACKSTNPLAKQRTIDEMDSKIEAQRYTFEAKTANPTSGRMINLTSSYTLKVTPDTITAYLPYFGRAYQAPMPDTDGGIKFTSTDFNYQVSDKQKGVYRVSIEIKDNNNKYKLSLLVGDTGGGSLHVIQQTKQSISFNGDIY